MIINIQQFDAEDLKYIKDGLSLTLQHAHNAMMRLEQSYKKVKELHPEEARTLEKRYNRSLQKYSDIARVYDRVVNIQKNPVGTGL